MIEKVDWDSVFFGYDVGMLRLQDDHNINLNTLFVESKRFRLTYVSSSKPIERHYRLNLVDIKVMLKMPSKGLCLSTTAWNGLIIEDFDLRKHSYTELLDLAMLSGKYSRFKTDKKFENGEFDKLYKEWIDRSIDHTIAERVLVCLDKKRICGFVTICPGGDNTSRIGLIAVDPDYRGLKIATNLIKSVDNYSFENGRQFIVVSTQNNNTPAMELYKQNGFRIVSREYIYHLWNQ